MNKKRKDPVPFTAAIKIDDAEAMLQWLSDPANSRKMVRLPVTVVYENEYRLALSSTYIGSLGDQDSDPVQIKMDDTRMGIGIRTHLRQHCPEGEQSCEAWIEVLWEDWEGNPSAKNEDGTYPVMVYGFVRKEDAPEERDMIWVAAN